MPKRLQAFICCFMLLKGAFAQQAFVQDTARQSAIQTAVALSMQMPREASPLYNGTEYIKYSPTFKGHAYFFSDDWQNASILYDGVFYSDVPALLDIVNDELIIRHFNGFISIKLVKEKIDQFAISGHNFINISADSTYSMQPGFYDRLYNGNAVLLVKRSKKLIQNVALTEIESRFEQKQYYYILNKGKRYSINNTASLLRALGDRRKDVQQYLRKNKLKFKQDPETTLIKAITFYDAPKY